MHPEVIVVPRPHAIVAARALDRQTARVAASLSRVLRKYLFWESTEYLGVR